MRREEVVNSDALVVPLEAHSLNALRATRASASKSGRNMKTSMTWLDAS